MRLFLLAAVVLPFYLLTGAESNVPAVKSVEPPLGYAGTPAPPPDYAQRVNWVLFPAAGTDSAEADLFYVYPTVTADRKNPLMHWEDPQLRDKTRNIALQQCALFDGVARIYAPFCRQLEFFRAMEALRGNRGTAAGFRPGEEDVKAAFDYYWNHENRGRRPFFLLGRGSGRFFPAAKRRRLFPAQNGRFFPAAERIGRSGGRDRRCALFPAEGDGRAFGAAARPVAGFGRIRALLRHAPARRKIAHLRHFRR